MKLHSKILIFLTLLASLSYGQTKFKIDSLLTAICDTKKSKDLSLREEAKQLINYGDKVLPYLVNWFTDTTKTEIKSDCQNLTLTKGDVAIIIADRIEVMPYAQLTNIQNCLIEFCKDNPNLIEYYLHAIRRDNVEKFQNRYVNWLRSNERKKWGPYLASKKKGEND